MRCLTLASFCVLLSVPSVAHADELAVSKAEAIRVGAARNPVAGEAQAALAESGAIREASRAALAYAPRVQLTGGVRDGAFGQGAELGAMVMQDLSLHGLGSARRDAASAFERAARSELDQRRLEGAEEGALAWVDMAEAQALFARRSSSLAAAKGIARVASLRVARGVALPLETALADAEVGTAEVSLRGAEGMIFEAKSRLRFALALPKDAEPVAFGTIETSGPPADTALSTKEHPVLAAARARTSLSTADAKVARAYASAPLGVGIAYTHEGTGEQTVTAVVSVPLPFLDPTRFDAARHQAAVRASQAVEVRTRAMASRDVAFTVHEREHTREVRDLVRDKVVVPLRESVRLGTSAYEAGTQDATSLFLLRQRLVAAEEQLDKNHADVQRADVRWAAVSGTLLDEVTTK